MTTPCLPAPAALLIVTAFLCSASGVTSAGGVNSASGEKPASGADTIYRCRMPSGHVEFRQFPCSGDATETLPAYHPTPAQTLPMALVSDAERARLEQADRQRRAEQVQSDAARGQARRSAARQRAQRSAACLMARAGQKSLARQRRKGYSLAEARDLDRRERELAAAERDNC